MSTPLWNSITDGFIAFNSNATAFLVRLFRDNGDHLKGVIDGAVDAPRVPAQVFAIQASGSGAGLTADMWNNIRWSVPSTNVPAGTIVEVDSGLFADGIRGILPAIKVTSGTNYALAFSFVEKPGGAGKYFLKLDNSTGTGQATGVTGTVLFLLLQ